MNLSDLGWKQVALVALSTVVVLTVVSLALLRIVGTITWSWWYILAPAFALAAIVFAIAVFIVANIVWVGMKGGNPFQ
jgi:hypothetical protein